MIAARVRWLSAPGRMVAAQVRRVAVTVGVAAGVLAGVAGPAAAHAGGLVATDARSVVVSVTPVVPGLSVTAIEDGARLRLRNATNGPVSVSGGGGPATPAAVTAGAELTWLDTRATPAGRPMDAGRRTQWTVTLVAGGTRVTVRGELIGEARPQPAPWWAAVAMLTVAVPLLARRLRRADLTIAALGLVTAAASVTHVAGSTMAVASAPPLTTFLTASGINLLAWPLIVGGAAATLRGRAAGVLAVCAGAALTSVFVLPDVTSFHRAVLPFAGPATLERLLVLFCLGVGAGTAVAGAPVLRRLAATAPPLRTTMAPPATSPPPAPAPPPTTPTSPSSTRSAPAVSRAATTRSAAAPRRPVVREPADIHGRRDDR